MPTGELAAQTSLAVEGLRQRRRNRQLCGPNRWFFAEAVSSIILVGVGLVSLVWAAGRTLGRPTSPHPAHDQRSRGFSDSRSTVFAKLAGAAYCPNNDLTTWTCGTKCINGVSDVHVCDGDTTKAYVALWEKQCIVSFMGTQEYVAFLRDLEFYKEAVSWQGCDNCSVHEGFFNEWNSLQECVKGSLEIAGCPMGSKIRVTGHSLGAAISALAMMSLSDEGWHVTEGYTFGMPRTGDEHFAREFNLRFRGLFYRVTHHMDPVVQLPPTQLITNWHFQHVEPEAFYDGNVSAGHSECFRDGDQHCSSQYYDIVHDMLYIRDHLEYMGIQIGTSGCNANFHSVAEPLPPSEDLMVLKSSSVNTAASKAVVV
mmetsp:Transcript_35004/g.81203  ORF Transcript_35004/g.81203 Transcript_35004/m.81203 type:complete len:369 (+) Transcript_35004:58-1164(+)